METERSGNQPRAECALERTGRDSNAFKINDLFGPTYKKREDEREKM